MSENTLRALLIRGGYGGGHVPRGFGAAFRTIMNERAERRWRETGRSGVSTDRAIIAVPFRFAVGSMPVKQAENAFYVDQAGPPVR
ncbi:hypothetical protein [Novosphingobium sp. Leaf2]|uniref:hypothetical protein n=1 Tax=Novosphingobium sp. Leaf2 TaxID=1735670 RepID=UPI0012E267D6|nr:hypothetical protein [Novosphingobium sp. Leaf2]